MTYLHVVPDNVICFFCGTHACEHIEEAIAREVTRSHHPASGE